MRPTFTVLIKSLRWSGSSSDKTIHLDSPAGPVNMKVSQNRDGTLWVDGVGKPGQEAADEADHDYIGAIGPRRLRQLKRDVERLSWSSPVTKWSGYRATGANPGRVVDVAAETRPRKMPRAKE